jgi:hypothetical protein
MEYVMLTDDQWLESEIQVKSSRKNRRPMNEEDPVYLHSDYAPWTETEVTLHRCTAPGCKSAWRDRVAVLFDTFEFDDVPHRIHFIRCEHCRGIHLFEQSENAPVNPARKMKAGTLFEPLKQLAARIRGLEGTADIIAEHLGEVAQGRARTRFSNEQVLNMAGYLCEQMCELAEWVAVETAPASEQASPV